MKIYWKQALGSAAISAMALSVIGTSGAAAQNTPARTKPVQTGAEKPAGETPTDTPSVDIELGQHLDHGPKWPHKSIHKTKSKSKTAEGEPADAASAEKGIKDPAVKGCSGCGMTGREAAAPPASEVPAPDSAGKKNKGPKVRDDPLSTRSSLLPILGAVTAIGLGVALASGGNDNPASP